MRHTKEIGPYANLYMANLRGADLREANLRGANLRVADLRGANLYKADLRGAYLYMADLCAADLRGVDLRGVDLRGVDLRGVDLRGAYLYGANLYGANLAIGGHDRRGYFFYGWKDNNGEIWIQAGCRLFPAGEALRHWEKRHLDNSALHAECLALVHRVIDILSTQEKAPPK